MWGVCQNNSSTSFVLFESDEEWCKEVARLFPEGAVFGQHGAADDSDTFRNMRPYAKNRPQRECCWHSIYQPLEVVWFMFRVPKQAFAVGVLLVVTNDSSYNARC